METQSEDDSIQIDEEIISQAASILHERIQDSLDNDQPKKAGATQSLTLLRLPDFEIEECIDQSVKIIGKKGQAVSWVWKYFTRYLVDSDSASDKKIERIVCKVEMMQSNGQKVPCNFVLAYHVVSNLSRHMKKHHQYLFLKEEQGQVTGKNAKKLEAKSVSVAANNVNKEYEEPITIPKLFDSGLSHKQKSDHQRRCVLWCAINLLPEKILRDEGLALVLGGISPWHAVYPPSHSTFNIILQEEYNKLEVIILESIKIQRESVKYGPFVVMSTDMTTTANRAWITLSIFFLNSKFEESDYQLDTVELPLDHHACQIADWITDATTRWFGHVMFSHFEPKDVYLAAIVDQGGNVANAIKNELSIALVVCCAHRLNSAIHWALGLSGSESTCKNPEMNKMIKRFAACVGVFSHATANSDILKSIQEELLTIAFELGLGDEGDDSTNIMEKIEYSLLRRNDTRWAGNHMMMDRLLRLKESINIFFNTQTKSSNKALSHHEFVVCREATSVLDPFMECTKLIQGGKFGYIAPTLGLLRELHKYCSGEMFEMRYVIYSNKQKLTSIKDHLVPCVRVMIDILLQEMEKRNLVGIPSSRAEHMAVFFDLSYRDRILEGQTLDQIVIEVKEDLKDLEFKLNPRREIVSECNKQDILGATAPKIIKLSSSFFERRRQIEKTSQPIPSADIFSKAEDEVDRYLKISLSNAEEDSYEFKKWWKEKYFNKKDESGEILSTAEFPYLSILAAKHGAYKSTSCQPERNFSQVAILLDRLRQSLSSDKAARMLFLRLNRKLVNGISDILDAKEMRMKAVLEHNKSVIGLHK